jgi:hypothetical protein
MTNGDSAGIHKETIVAYFRKIICYWTDRRLSAKLVPNFEDRGYRVVSSKNPYGRILGFLERSSYYFFQVDPQL